MILFLDCVRGTSKARSDCGNASRDSARRL